MNRSPIFAPIRKRGLIRVRSAFDWHGQRFLYGREAKPKAGDDWIEEPDDELEDLLLRCRDGAMLQTAES